MAFLKTVKDYMLKALLGRESVPPGLLEMKKYFRTHGAIRFEQHREGDVIVAVSTNFRFGSIVTSGNEPEELEKNIRDAILTSFEIPVSYAREADIKKVAATTYDYAPA